MLYARLNLKSGGTGWIAIPLSMWHRHATADLAVAPMAAESDEPDFMFFSLAGTGTEARLSEEEIGPGDEVFTAGLFVHRSGLERNVPIIRVGNLAAMPDEPIDLPEWGRMDAYLIEARSIGGLSGSPVFVHYGSVRVRDGKLVHAPTSAGIFLLLGVMHGHFDGGLSPLDTADGPDGARERVNVGIAIVVPVERLIVLLDEPELAANKKRSLEARASGDFRAMYLEDVSGTRPESPSG